MTDARLYAATSKVTSGVLDRADSGRRQAAILTPEGVELRVELAERGERAGAFLIDGLIIAAAVIALVIGTLYLTALLQGYEDKPPAGFKLPPTLSYNRYFPGNAIAMPKPMEDGRVTYEDGSPQTLAQYSKDVSAFLMWAAEPHMEARKRIGFQVMIFLIVLAGLLYFTKKKVWADAH
jgi:hypothetical protein